MDPLRQYVAFYLMERKVTFGNAPYDSYLHSFNALFEEWIVVQWAKLEQQRLWYLRSNQPRLRADLYHDVVSQASVGSTPASQVGRRIVLPSSFTGGPRYMTQLYHDGMALVRNLGKADLFLTFTAPRPSFKVLSYVVFVFV